LDYRRYLWSLGLGVAEAMDTAQRGMGLDWEVTKKLIECSVKEAEKVGGEIACGAGTDHLESTERWTLEEIERAYMEQCHHIEKHGGKIILMASRALATTAADSADYKNLYSRVINQIEEPVILHWLGEMFDPQLKGYWGHDDVEKAMDVCLELIHEHKNK